MGIYILKRKTFTQYDDTDMLKKMKDSDILAEREKRPTMTGGKIALVTGGTAVAGGLAGAVLHPAFGKYKGMGRAGFSKAGRRIVQGGKAGLLIGAGIGLAGALGKRTKEKADNSFYNDRLEYAKRQARRREKSDWKSNMTQRDGYSY